MNTIKTFLLSMLFFGLNACLANEPTNANKPLGIFGVNLSGTEFGETTPGKFATDYIYPNAQELDYFKSKGLRLIRLPFRWKRIQTSLGGE